LDLYVTDLDVWGDKLFLREPDDSFVYATEESGLKGTADFTGWGVGMHDFDNDGDIDIFVANGKACLECAGGDELNLLYLNDGKGVFTRFEGAEGSGLALSEKSRGAVFSDIDKDGDLDALVTNVGAGPTLLRNELGAGNWLQLHLRDTHLSPPVGAVVTAQVGDATQLRVVTGAPSYGGSGTQWVHFGLGPSQQVAKLTVRWPDGATQTLADVAANQFLVIERETPAPPLSGPLTPETLPDCATICSALEACDALDYMDASDRAGCATSCAAEPPFPYADLCVTVVTCDEITLCEQGEEGDHRH